MKRTLLLKRLAQRTIKGDSQAAIVLGDALMEQGADHLVTGRVRKARFHFLSANRAHRDTLFTVPAREMLFNVGNFAADPTDQERWDTIFTMWITPRRDIYRSMRAAGMMRGVRFGSIRWVPMTSPMSGVIHMGWELFTGQKRLGIVARLHQAAVDEVHFNTVTRRDPTKRRRRR